MEKEINFNENYSFDQILQTLKENNPSFMKINNTIISSESNNLVGDILKAIDSIPLDNISETLLKLKKSIEEQILSNIEIIKEKDYIYQFYLGQVKFFINDSLLEEFERLQIFTYNENRKSFILMINILQAIKNFDKQQKNIELNKIFNNIDLAKDYEDLNNALNLIKIYTNFDLKLYEALYANTLKKVHANQKEKIKMINEKLKITS